MARGGGHHRLGLGGGVEITFTALLRENNGMVTRGGGAGWRCRDHFHLE